MAEAAKQIEIDDDVKGTRGLEDQIEVITPDKPDTEAIESAEKPVKETTEADLVAIKERMDAAETARKEADERAARAREELETANQRLSQEKGSRFAAQESAIANAMAAIESEAEQAETTYATAMQAGDFTAAAKAQRVMSAAEAKKVRLEDSRQTVASWKQQASQERDPLEQQFPDPRTRAWIKDHPQYLEDSVFRADCAAAHERALKAGHPINSSGYFKYIEDKVLEKPALKNPMNLRIVENEDEPVETEPEVEVAKPKVEAKPKAKVSSAAPPSRASAATTGQREKVSLTKDEADFALTYARDSLTLPGENNIDDATILRRYAYNKSLDAKEGKRI